MKTWDDWSDFEINESVEKITGMYCVDCEGKYIPTFDYCNNWADMGPLIESNAIAIYPSNIPKEWESDGSKSLAGLCFYRAETPLRAAAIVFLMMNGVKP